MSDFHINTETCSKCGICVDVCPANVIEKNTNGIVAFKQENIAICLGCGQCMAVCNTKSIFAKGLKYETDLFEFADTESFLSLLQHRRSVRRFKAKAVSKEEIEKIIQAVSYAPHGDSHQHVEITVVNSREKIMEALPLMSAFFDKLAGWLHNPFMRKMIQFKKGTM